jgi:hypothetical protein
VAVAMKPADYWSDFAAGTRARVREMNAEREAKAKTRYPSVHVYDTLAAMLAAEPLDLVVVSTPHATHAPYARAALAKGAHVVVDKPFATSSAEARDLAAAARAAGKLAIPFQNRRWDNEVLTLGLRYGGGPFTAVAAYEIRRDADEDAAPGRANVNNLSLGATYDLSSIQLHAAYGRLKHRGFRRTAEPESSWLDGASVTIGGGELLAGYQRVANRNLNEHGVDGTRHGYALAYEYELSSRTSLYVYGSRFQGVDVREDDDGRLAKRIEFGSGVRFTF